MLLPYQQHEAEILARDASREAIRARQYLAWRTWRHQYPPLATRMMKHSLNELADWRRCISGGRLALFEGRPVIGEAA